MTRAATWTRAEIERAIAAADAKGKVALQTRHGIAYVDPASLPNLAPDEERPNSCDGAFR
jgi:hypothetical protein